MVRLAEVNRNHFLAQSERRGASPGEAAGRCWRCLQTLTGASVKREGSPEEALMSSSSVCSWGKQIRRFQGAMIHSPFFLNLRVILFFFSLFYLICSMKEVVQGLRITAQTKETEKLRTSRLGHAIAQNEVTQTFMIRLTTKHQGDKSHLHPPWQLRGRGES